MKKNILGLVSTMLLLSLARADASEFSGPYVGIDGGANISTSTAQVDKKSAYAAAVAGYNWDFQRYLVGANVFYDGHGESYTKNDAGVDVKLGLDLARWMPYLKLGVAGTSPGTRVHAGLGFEYKFAARWSVNGEWTVDSKSSGPTNYNNNNFLVGVNYYFWGGSKGRAAETAMEAVPAPVSGADPVGAKALASEQAQANAAPKPEAPKQGGATQGVPQEHPITSQIE